MSLKNEKILTDIAEAAAELNVLAGKATEEIKEVEKALAGYGVGTWSSGVPFYAVGSKEKSYLSYANHHFLWSTGYVSGSETAPVLSANREIRIAVARSLSWALELICDSLQERLAEKE